MLNLNKFYDIAMTNSLLSIEERNLEQIEYYIKQLERERNKAVKAYGINDYVINLQEIISELSIDYKEALHIDYTKDLEILEYILSINIIRNVA